MTKKRHLFPWVVLSFLLLGLFSSKPVYAILIGGGIGLHYFTEADGADDLRTENTSYTRAPEADQGIVNNLYVETYLIGGLGIGYVHNGYFATTTHVDTSSDIEITKNFIINNDFLVLQYVFGIGSTGYWRLGLRGGTGRISYSYSERYEEGNNVTNTDKAQSGTASLSGFFFDGGSSALGIRVGYQTVTTQLDNLTVRGVSNKIDASGQQIYVEARYFF